MRPSIQHSPLRRVALPVTAAVWGLLAVAGGAAYMARDATPDTAAFHAPAVWPASLPFARGAGRATLVVCLHPLCPCSDATVDAVEQFISKNPASTVYAVLAVPATHPEWAEKALAIRCRQIPGLRVIFDTDGRSCSTLDAHSSGQAFLYDAGGRLTFAGGLTPGRGVRPTAVLDPADAAKPNGIARSAVFGCALVRPPSPGATSRPLAVVKAEP